MKLEWKYIDEADTHIAVTDYGVFRIYSEMYRSNGKPVQCFTLYDSDPELNCNTNTYNTLRLAKHAAEQRYAEILAREVTR